MFKALSTLAIIVETEASKKGRNAFLNGQPETSNPFSAQTRLAQDWLVGWKDVRRQAAAKDAAETRRDAS